jgi:2-polyprenyl-3-methyl-5-hydroxy-6-metoxy-1,4-benzoquinol methylase
MQGGFSKAYQEKGVATFYEQEGGKYKNPHAYDIERIIRKKLTPPNKFLSPEDTILDLACGGGEATLPLLSLGYKRIEATDPYTAALFTENTKIKC